jgi:cytochrome c5
MKKVTSVLVSAVVFAGMVSSAQASVQKGQKYYLKQCKKCHGGGTKGASMKTQDEWEELFEDEAAAIKEVHQGTKGEKYINGKKFKKSAPHLKDFLYEYGSDSGNVPACG